MAFCFVLWMEPQGREGFMMMKKIFALLLALTLACAVAAPACADQLVSLNSYATASFSGSFDVYSGPGTSYYRANNGKASYGGGVARVYGVTNGWVMIGYQLSSGSYRIGYIESAALDKMYNLKGDVNYNLYFSAVSVRATEDCKLTDDPVVNTGRVTTVSQGTTVTALGAMSDWVYVETVIGSQYTRGFIRSKYLTTSSGEPITPQPTKAPATARPSAPTAQPSYPTAQPYPTAAPTGNSLLSSLTHNCPNTGIMLPASFNPYQTTYLLTVASWVSRPTFTPTAYDPNAVITVNGQVVRSGQTSQVIPMTDKPQAVTIVVTSGSASTTYTIYLQRRPSEKRTSVSSGYINSIYQRNNTWYIDTSLVKVNYAGDTYDTGNLSSFTAQSQNQGSAHLPVSAHCDLYFGTRAQAIRATNIQQFISNYQLYGSTLYTFVCIEDEIVAIFPYGADY